LLKRKTLGLKKGLLAFKKRKKNRHRPLIMRGKKIFRLPRYYSLLRFGFTRPNRYNTRARRVQKGVIVTINTLLKNSYNSPVNFRFYLKFFSVTPTYIKPPMFFVFGLLYQLLTGTIISNINVFFTKNFYKLVHTYLYYRPHHYYKTWYFVRGNNSFFGSFFGKHRKLLMLNFRRFRFFPNIQSVSGHTYTSLSLGLFSKFFNKGKSFIKNKGTFMVVAGFLRKILLYSSLKQLMLVVKKTPLYLQEILSSINSPVIGSYKHPFDKLLTVDEAKLGASFYFYMFIFYNSRPFNYLKTRKRGRIKRKITKRIVKMNRLVD